VGFFKRLFSADYRAAVAAEAGGDLELAAERYALAGQGEAAARVHLARAERAETRASEIDALRDALHWAPEGEWRRRVCRALGRALLSRARAEGVATERDRERVREAAGHLLTAGEHREAGEALESIGDDAGAVAAYRAGGLVDRLESALWREERRTRAERDLRESFADYELAMRGGARDAAAEHLRRCVEVAESRGEYRRLLDELESRLVTGGRVVLELRKGEQITLFSGTRLLLGRDPLCDLVLRSGGVSRRHSEIGIEEAGGEVAYLLRDAGSRNGTRVGGMPVTGAVPLAGTGSFALGDDCEVGFRVEGGRLELRIDRGLDQGTVLYAAPEGQPIPLAGAGIAIAVQFQRGRPIALHPRQPIQLNGERLAHGDVQLVHGDVLSVDGTEIRVA
jgi:tetratricopeptide (TPR) repeat protein